MEWPNGAGRVYSISFLGICSSLRQHQRPDIIRIIGTRTFRPVSRSHMRIEPDRTGQDRTGQDRTG
ncbi:hypothetical protein B0T26DRAFT_731374 [Lasiosphaeria miniovina]|uniref:Uncharacterized protein n=1 Tax=Lasiosphaeria miniovina TaxID=1954250 RepID=A0AA39ZTT1_9PEZI|nr:uncharacterized protein B0T26DRAFT_731374 [Lasiosphaeria miniovina]KAK0703451.1 hypothetical protein B0T26DRAFT_731374 [Lasiosphaeria miniovina]